MMSTTTIVLPDLISAWPSTPALNPHYQSVGAASTHWVENFHILDPKAQAILRHCKVALLASLAYPHVDADHLRLICDSISWFFVFEGLSDIKNGASMQKLAASVVDAIRNPHTTPGASVIGDMTKWSVNYRPSHKGSLSYRVGAACGHGSLHLLPPSAIQRLAASIEQYIESVCVEAEDRERGLVRNTEDYLAVRRGTAATGPCLDFILMKHDVPEEIMSHPYLQKLTQGAMDMLIYINDIYSYNFERRHGQDGHNIISVVMKEKSLDIQGAFNLAGDLFRRTAQEFLRDLDDIPLFPPPIDQAVSDYLSGLNSWVTAQYEWSFETERYFGTNGQDIKRNRTVELCNRPSSNGV